MYYYTSYPSKLGTIYLYARDQALLALYFEDQRYEAEDLVNEAQETPDQAILSQTRAWLDSYFAGQNPDPRQIPLDPRPQTPFRRIVWDLLLDIPYGGLVSYRDLAQETAKIMGKEKMSAQAVGGALGHNPISIIIPCHRVVGANGSLTGYGGGIDRKIGLLTLEGHSMEGLYRPIKDIHKNKGEEK